MRPLKSSERGLLNSLAKEGIITMTRKPAVKKGFTLIELMAVILILAILAGVALPRFFNYQTQAREAATKGTLGGVRAGIANFYANKAISASAAVYPTFAELTTLGTVMQESTATQIK